ncbi:ABC transporter ATP-binding protein [Gordonibacter sp. 28C]|uniref:ABC transporter ATP-binding protein n=1 Tax=Gordonibacter sp. 28C TaxID=2078569 RepID=UPI000DF79D8D|nr:ATP-binding cassette domain-containing protein [Gordonibacter sp. 28C]RDB63878.1 ABC transporter ATP-binding protein [Gordonibacter sp. 28C]
MEDAVIRVDGLTKDYGHGRGVFDLDLRVKRGEVFGYVGTNGSGKTTTIRHLMGFIKPDAGSTSILGMDSWRDSTRIMNHVSYVPGEIAFPSLPTGTAFLKSQAEFLGVTDFTYLNHVVKLLQLDPSANLKRMSKGMKQKTAIAAALMGDKEILVLDEPTTGLDPLMRDTFLDLVRAEKAKGRTVFMSSHIFEEIEEVCDRVAMIRDGKIIEVFDLRELRNGDARTFHVAFASRSEAGRFAGAWKPVKSVDEAAATVTVEVSAKDLNHLLRTLKAYSVASLSEEHFTLEQHFKNVYLKGAN